MHVYRDSIIIAAPIEEVFDFYVDLRNLTRMTTRDLHMRVLKAELPLREGSRVRFSLRHRIVPFEVRWDAVISRFERPRVFEDRQTHGPFDRWVHRHEFLDLGGDRTEVTDTIECGVPLGVLGRMAERYVVGAKLEELFRHRRSVVRREFESRRLHPKS